MTLAGLAIGAVASLLLARFLQSLLYGVAPYDPVVMLLAAALLSAVTLAACYLPAYRASRIDPIVALREE
jgi:ABC-type antimicrobial peptide transport system permease subunit